MHIQLKQLGGAVLLPLSLVLSAAPASADVSRECRGVAAGVVASMRAREEISGDEAVQAAVLAARRACAAALEGFDSEQLADASEDDDGEEPGVWEILSQDRELKPGNERLRRLRN